MDRISSDRRRWNMAQIRSKNTQPERVVRSLLHRMGYRFRLHRADLPGTPDIVLPKYRTVILVHGCYWHRHPNCQFAYTPKTNVVFWLAKFEENVVRDARDRRALRQLGWSAMIVWECETRDIEKLSRRLRERLDGQVGQ